MTIAATARPLSLVTEFGFAPSPLRLAGCPTPGRRNSRGAEGLRLYTGTVSISGDDYQPSTDPHRAIVDAKSRDVVFRCQVAQDLNEAMGLIVGATPAGVAGNNWCYVYCFAGSSGGLSGVRTVVGGSDTRQIAGSDTSAGAHDYEIRWLWPYVEVYVDGSLNCSGTLTGTHAGVSAGTWFGIRNSSPASEEYRNFEVWARPSPAVTKI